MTTLTLTNPAPLAPGRRLPALDELKGVALLLVITYHATGVLNLPNYLHGEIGVDIFLLISGLALSFGGARLTAAEFWSRRFFKIFPAYWAAFALFYLLDYELRGISISPLSFWLHLFGLHAFGPERIFFDVNSSFWFIGLIVPLYFVFFLMRRHLEKPSWIIALGLMLGTAVCLSYEAAGHRLGLIQAGIRIPSFFMGVVLGGLVSRPEWKLDLNLPLGLALLGVTYLSLSVQFFYAIAAVSITVFFLAVRGVLANRGLGQWVLRGLGILGVYSYEIYLLHQPLMGDYNLLALDRWFKVSQPTAAQLTAGIMVGLLVTGVLAFGLHRATRILFHRLAPARPPTAAHA